MSAVRELKAKGFDVDYEWDPHNVDDPFVTFYIMDKMNGYMNILRDNLVGWDIKDLTEEGDDVITIEAKPVVQAPGRDTTFRLPPGLRR
jgi:hypothetical protein